MSLAVRLAVSMVAVVLFTATAVAVLTYRSLEASVLPWRLERLGEHTRQLADGIARHVDGAGADVLAVAALPPISGLVRAAAGGGVDPADGSTAAAWRDRLATSFEAVLGPKPAYLQLRLLDVDGRELVRVDRPHARGGVRRTPEPELQEKGERPYFQAAARLGSGEVYVSPIELNREHGAIERPARLVARIATAIPTAGGPQVLVLNVDMGPALEKTRSAATATGGAVYVVDGGGRFLVHPDRGRELAAEPGADLRFAVAYPQLADLVGGPATVRSADLEGDRFGVSAATVRLEGGPPVTVVEMVPEGVLLAVGPLGRSSLLAAALASVVALLLAALLGQSVRRSLAEMRAALEAFAGGRPVATPVRATGEIGEVARALHQASQEIREKTAALEREVGESRRLEERFRLVVESAPSGMLIVDEAGIIQLVNAAAERLFGYGRAELVGQAIELLVPSRFAGGHARLRAGFMARPEMRQMGVGRDLRAVRRDGEEIPVEVGLSPFAAPEGPRVLCTVVDITARKAAEDALAERTRELERSNADLEQFAYVASHDLKEPLRMVASYSQLLGERYRGQLDARADTYIRHLVDGARRMQQLVSDLLAYSRVGSETRPFESTDTKALLDDVLASLRRAIEESGAEVERGAAPTVLADPMQLGQVFQNLIANALKFRRDEPPRVRLDAARVDGFWRFEVADNGIGIEAEYASRIFQMFQRLHERERYPGNGIGLAIAKRIVERHGGRIWFESTPGEGATFYFTLPSRGDA